MCSPHSISRAPPHLRAATLVHGHFVGLSKQNGVVSRRSPVLIAKIPGQQGLPCDDRDDRPHSELSTVKPALSWLARRSWSERQSHGLPQQRAANIATAALLWIFGDVGKSITPYGHFLGHYLDRLCLRGSRCPLLHEGSFRPINFRPQK
jgi:hypothetical protein